MAENLQDVKKELYRLFNAAVERQAEYEDPSTAYSSKPANFKIQSRIAIGTLGQAIAAVEREEREAKERGFARLDKSL